MKHISAHRLLSVLVVFAAAISRAADPAATPPLPVVAPATPAAGTAEKWNWDKEIQAFEDADKVNPPPRDAILFVGSSTIRLWKTLAKDFPGYTVINRGFGGSMISDSVRYADRIVIRYQPRLIVFFAGGNDLDRGKTPAQVAADFKAFVEKVRAALPQVRIAYMAITPNPLRLREMDTERQTNELIKAYIAGVGNTDYIDTYTPYLDASGTPRADLFREDKLHNNAAGYKLRVEIVKPHLKGFESKPVAAAN
jgi:lysophospholipase L1-like esterase